MGAFSSSLFFVYRNFKGNYILSSYRLIDLLAFPLLKTFSKNINHSWENDIKLLGKNVINDSEDSSLGIIPLCNLNSTNYFDFYEIAKKE